MPHVMGVQKTMCSCVDVALSGVGHVRRQKAIEVRALRLSCL